MHACDASDLPEEGDFAAAAAHGDEHETATAHSERHEASVRAGKNGRDANEARKVDDCGAPGEARAGSRGGGEAAAGNSRTKGEIEPLEPINRHGGGALPRGGAGGAGGAGAAGWRAPGPDGGRADGRASDQCDTGQMFDPRASEGDAAHAGSRAGSRAQSQHAAAGPARPGLDRPGPAGGGGGGGGGGGEGGGEGCGEGYSAPTGCGEGGRGREESGAGAEGTAGAGRHGSAGPRGPHAAGWPGDVEWEEECVYVTPKLGVPSWCVPALALRCPAPGGLRADPGYANRG
jgi:hypothetical protein